MSVLYYACIFGNRSKTLLRAAHNILTPFDEYLNNAINAIKRVQDQYALWEKSDDVRYKISPLFTQITIECDNLLEVDFGHWYEAVGTGVVNTKYPLYNILSPSEQPRLIREMHVDNRLFVQFNASLQLIEGYRWGVTEVMFTRIQTVTSIEQEGKAIYYKKADYSDNKCVLECSSLVYEDKPLFINGFLPVSPTEFKIITNQIDTLSIDGKNVNALKQAGNRICINGTDVNTKTVIKNNNRVVSFKIMPIDIPNELECNSNKIYPVREGGAYRIDDFELATTTAVGTDSDNLQYVLQSTTFCDPNALWIKLIDDTIPEDKKWQLASKLDMFFEDGVSEVEDRKNHTKYFIVRKDKERLKLLIKCSLGKFGDKLKYGDLPDRLFLPVNPYQLFKQQEAIRDLKSKPMIDHAPLMQLMENPDKCAWPNFEPLSNVDWLVLKDVNYDGTQSQRRFVQKALATPDFAFLEGPPGSGKTTAIIELILQLLIRGKRVLLSASTHVAIDNVLEKVITYSDVAPVFPIRIGDETNIYNEDLKRFLLGRLIPENSEYKNVILDSANLVCGTTVGILQHPLLKRDRSDQKGPIDPEFDYLIIDESSKTTFQEFLVPAMRARRWVLVGDIRQLSPYTDQTNIEDNFEYRINGRGMANLLIAYLLANDRLNRSNPPACFLLSTTDFNQMISEMDERIKNGKNACKRTRPFVFLHERNDGAGSHRFDVIGVNDFISHTLQSTHIFGADYIFVDASSYDVVSDYIPANAIVFDVQKQNLDLLPIRFRRNGLYPLGDPDSDVATDEINDKVLDKTWENEVVWKMIRYFEGRLTGTNESYIKDIESLLPEIDGRLMRDHFDRIFAIALPSILESLQKGIRVRRDREKDCVLTEGFPRNSFIERHELLEYQHRMHPDISAFSRKAFYANEALRDAREVNITREWGYSRYKSRNIWIDVTTPKPVYRHINLEETIVIMKELDLFLTWAHQNRRPQNEIYTVAVLTFYRAQERELRSKLQKKSGLYARTSCFPIDNVTMYLQTVDKFQGREADIAFISMVNNNKIGFMDNVNRLNVGMTRAKYQRVIVGDHQYYIGKRGRDHRCSELKLLAETAVLGGKP